MARKSSSRSSSKSSSKSNTTQTTETPFSTGVFGHLLTGSIVSCDANDNSFFCNITKVFNGLMMIIGILLIIYFIYYFAKLYLFNKKK